MKLRAIAWPLLVATLWGGALLAAVTAVHARHEARKLFVGLERLYAERDRMNIEWGRLRLEQSTWATHARVEALAREELHMRNPQSAEVVIVRQ